jgi:hypothetical protein
MGQGESRISRVGLQSNFLLESQAGSLIILRSADC